MENIPEEFGPFVRKERKTREKEGGRRAVFILEVAVRGPIKCFSLDDSPACLITDAEIRHVASDPDQVGAGQEDDRYKNENGPLHR